MTAASNEMKGVSEGCLTLILMLILADKLTSYTLFGQFDNSNTCSDKAHQKGCYLHLRDKVRFLDGQKRTGSKIALTEKEEAVDEIIANAKREDILGAFKRGYSLSSRPLHEVRSEIERSTIFKILRAMPKGCELHVHDATIANFDWIVQNVTYREDCYLCFDHKLGLTLFRLSKQLPMSMETCQWMKCQQQRMASGSEVLFDYQLYNNFTIASMTFNARTSQRDKWIQFEKVFLMLSGLLSELDVFAEYYRRGLAEFMEDNVQCLEVRAVLGRMYSANGTNYDDEKIPLQIYDDVTREFIRDNGRDFYGTRIIYSSRRYKKTEQVRSSILKALQLKEKFPDLLAGFDLVGHEESGHPLLYYLDELLLPQRLQVHLPFYLHAGETNWEDPQVEVNLIDALLLNSSRIGHGLALTRHPFLRKRLRQRNISVEVCPISNQALGLISDLNDHPAAIFLSEGYPMTVSSDDPAIWGAKGTSYDWYYVFMGMTQHHDGLRLLKQLAMDSIRYSSFEESAKESMLKRWLTKWDQFIDFVIETF